MEESEGRWRERWNCMLNVWEVERWKNEKVKGKRGPIFSVYREMNGGREER